jgi:hypothetical protein
MERIARDPATTPAASPVLSLVVVVYDMPEQARRTLVSLSPGHQAGVSAADYEVIVVENASPRLLGEDAALATGPNVRYFLRDETSSSPVFAVNAGGAAAQGEMLGILVDGARLVTPGVVRLALMAHRATRNAVVSVPGYHLGSELQQRAVASGYDERTEAALLESIGWPEDGYRLFDVACFSGSCAAGFLVPFAESNCLCVPKAVFDELGGFDPGFVLPGGGFSNLDFYARVCEREDVTLFVTPGEGTFHQFHGGVTTGGGRADDRVSLMRALRAEYAALRGGDLVLPTREPLLLGHVPLPARRFVRQSAEAWHPKPTPEGAP